MVNILCVLPVKRNSSVSTAYFIKTKYDESIRIEIEL